MNLGDGKLKLTIGSLIVVEGSKCCSLYKLQAQIVGHEMNVADHNSSPDLWHMQLEHNCQNGLKVFSRGNIYQT